MSLSPCAGVGFYSYPEAARIIGIKPAKLRRWVGQYLRRAPGAEYVSKPVVSRYFQDGEHGLTFPELVELLLVKLFREEGLSMPVIRRAAEEAARQFDTPYPFAARRFDTDGGRIFATLQEEAQNERVVVELGKG
jgi:transposase-like protein